MFFNKSFLAVAAMLIGSASAFTGTDPAATVGFTGTTNCGCPATNGPFAVSIPSALAGTHVCCTDSITITHGSKSVVAVYNGNFDAGAGTQNIQLSQVAFTAIEDSTSDTSLAVTWAFN
ncbi:hypothetical protein B0H19DRAFT_1073965 [Mycena capillaripes]|nr:hypothetical protein B0H19DRAFT_1073963 [Mycena capillaripes]KAJ6550077.1 hypothetical protein B0H19DRAFT_1073965 [Mycena capillaripes]